MRKLLIEKRSPLTVKGIICTCGDCPSQWEVSLENGKMMYIRYRWGYLSVRISPDETKDIYDAVGGEEVYGNQLSDGLDGVLDYEDLRKELIENTNIILPKRFKRE
jgi:hypothetical protein